MVVGSLFSAFRRSPGARFGAYLLPLALTACSDAMVLEPDGGLPLPDGGSAYSPDCEHLNSLDCLLPWPSSRFLVDDESTATGRRLEIPLAAMPRSAAGGTRVDPGQLQRFDGFSPATSIITAYPGRVVGEVLPDELHIEDSLVSSSPTVLLDAVTLERVAHFAELDQWPSFDSAEERRPLYIRPAQRLAEGHRYIVAVRGLTYEGGASVEPSDYFRALRDDLPLAEESDVESRRSHFEDIFASLEQAGVERGTLIEAWDFETASGEPLWGDLVRMRDLALVAMEADEEPRCALEEPLEDPIAGIWRRVHGTVRVPLFLNGTNASDSVSSSVHRDAEGRPTQNGWTDVPFTVNIPHVVREAVEQEQAPGRLVDYGHGLLGNRDEGDTGWMRDTLVQNAMVGVAIDWWGMSTADISRIATTLTEFSPFYATAERLQQGVVNHIALQRAFLTGCAELPQLSVPLGEGHGSAPAIGTDELYFYGNSQGGILGLVVAAVAVDVERFAIGVGGMSYSTMILRSANWRVYEGPMSFGYKDPLVRALLMTMAQSLWDLSEASSYVSHILADPLPCDVAVCPSGLTGLKKVLFQVGHNDAKVPALSAYTAARTMGLPYLPSSVEPWGLIPLSADYLEVLGDSALVIYDLPGTQEILPGTRNPGDDNTAHDGVRRWPSAIDQIDRFLRPDGAVVQTCAGICGED